MRSLIFYYFLVGVAGSLLAVGLCTLIGILAGKIPLSNDSFLFLLIVFTIFEVVAWAQYEYGKAIDENEGANECS